MPTVNGGAVPQLRNSRHTALPDGLGTITLLSSLLGGLCAQFGVLCLQRLDLGLDLPLERAAPLGKLGLAEDVQPALPIEQVVRNSAQLRLLLACCSLSRWPVRSCLAGLRRLLLGILW